METRTFYICDDDSDQLYVAKIVRKQDEVKPELWYLKIGDTYEPEGSSQYFMRAE